MILRGMLLIRFRRLLWRSRGRGGWRGCRGCYGENSSSDLRGVWIAKDWTMRRPTARHVLAVGKHFREAPSQERSANPHAVYHM